MGGGRGEEGRGGTLTDLHLRALLLEHQVTTGGGEEGSRGEGEREGEGQSRSKVGGKERRTSFQNDGGRGGWAAGGRGKDGGRCDSTAP